MSRSVARHANLKAASSAVVFDIQRFSVHDGPGIRTTVFFKGCSLDCDWCQNPESKSARPELSYSAKRCIDCGNCRGVCPNDALAETREGRVDWSRCVHCGVCDESCPSGALTMIGRPLSADALLEEVSRDQAFYRSSGGGVTLSGGEPVLHWRFLLGFLPLLRAADLHVLLQTAGNYAWCCLEPLLPWIDEIYFDWKLPDPIAYRRYTHRQAQHPFDNLARLITAGVPTTVRMPVIPSVNDTRESVITSARALASLGVDRITLLKVHALWEAKLARLDPRRRRVLPLTTAIDWSGVKHGFADNGVTANGPF